MSWGNKGNNGPWGGGGGSRKRPPSGSGGSKKPSGGDIPDLELVFKKGQDSFKSSFGDGSGKKPFIVLGLILIAIWLSTGFYRIDAGEVGIELRFGKFSQQTEAGLNYHLPYPIETVEIIDVENLNRVEVGYRSSGGGYSAHGGNRSVPEESLMLTGDKNVVSAQFEVLWRVKDAKQYLFNMRNTHYVVKPVAETAMREIMGNTPISMALSEDRSVVAENTKDLMQKILDSYEVGVKIYQVNLLAVDAPEPVVDAFIDLLASQQEKETLRNKALKYQEGILPVAKGIAEKKIKDAQAYKEAVVAKAQGEAARFKSVYNEYRMAKNVTKKRMYLETMEEIMAGMNKIIMSDKSTSSGVVPYLPLPAVQRAEKQVEKE